MKIGMLIETSFPPDPRVENEIRLLKTEYDLHVLCPVRSGQFKMEIWEGVSINRVFSKFKRKWESFKLRITLHSSGWRRAISRFVETNKIDVLHVHDLPLLGPALQVGQVLKIPVVADLHENYPAFLAQKFDIPYHQSGSLLIWLFNRLFVSIERWQQYEASLVPQAEAVITVIEEAQERIVNLGVDPDRVYVVANYAPLSELLSIIADMESLQSAEEEPRFRVTYAGGFGASRDLHTVIDATTILKDEIPELLVTLVGGQEKDVALLQSYASQKGVSQQVRVLGWHPFEQFVGYIANSTLCLVAHAKTAHTDTTIPHKLFQYMAFKKPVIVSNCAPLERIVRETGAGLVYQAGDPMDLAECILRIYGNADFSTSAAQKGYQAVIEKYNWQHTSQALLRLYHKIDGSNQGVN